ncbi:hypothetical protein Ddye_025916 [Dipteronia dyeriana]|uniref:Uncharacterized protein n=1 Tax=Dipteronia dyeriana TaxID=168575 RepID=A0AAD9TLR1_9ROSI|nr:hypothetical protein Ddye_025916 [Dipteronia dyeriana]
MAFSSEINASLERLSDLTINTKDFELPPFDFESHKRAKTRSELVSKRKVILGLGFGNERWEILVAAVEWEGVEANGGIVEER